MFNKGKQQQVEVHCKQGAALRSTPFTIRAAVCGTQVRKKWSVGLIAPSATESTCSHKQTSQIVNKANPSQAELHCALGAALDSAPLTIQQSAGRERTKN